jgi:hypothetical protein
MQWFPLPSNCSCTWSGTLSGWTSRGAFRKVRYVKPVARRRPLLRVHEGNSYATYGLSRHMLAPGGDAQKTQEFVLSVDDREYAIDVLRTLDAHLLKEHHALFH